MIFLGVVCVIIFALAFWSYTPDRSYAYLAARYDAAAANITEIDGANVRFKDTGVADAPAIVLLHGFGASLETWEPWATELSQTYRVIRLDLPGFGLSGPDPSEDYSDLRAGKLLAGLMQHLRISKACIIGNSLGGKIAWNFAVDFPDLVTGLVLISPDGFASPGFAYDEPVKLPFILKFLPVVMPRWMLRLNLAVAYADPAKLTAQMLARYNDMMRAPGNRKAMLTRMQQVILRRPEPRLQQIKAPTLILWGEQDKMIPFSNAQNYLSAIPRAKLTALPKLGHVPFEEAPGLSLPPLQAFLNELLLAQPAL